MSWSPADFRRFVREHDWIFARTMPENPHEYTLRANTSGAVFEAAVRFIRERGEPELYYGKDFTVYFCDDHKYWTMGAPIQETALINRKSTTGGPRTSGRA